MKGFSATTASRNTVS